MAQLKRASDVFRDKDVLDRHLVGTIAFHQFGNPLEEGPKLTGKGIAVSGEDSPVVHVDQRCSVFFDDPISGDLTSWIDSKNSHALSFSMISSGISKFAKTFWTSS